MAVRDDPADAGRKAAAASLPDGGRRRRDPTGAPSATASPTTSGPRAVTQPKLLGEVAALGPRTLETVPAGTTKAVVVRGDGPTASTATIELYALSKGAWKQQATWRGHLGAKGWTNDHHEGDLRTPAGTYTLSDAGGLLADPGTKLPYHRSEPLRADRVERVRRLAGRQLRLRDRDRLQPAQGRLAAGRHPSGRRRARRRDLAARGPRRPDPRVRVRAARGDEGAAAGARPPRTSPSS